MVHCATTSTLAKVGTNGEVYAVLMDGNGSQEGATASVLRNQRRPSLTSRSCGWTLVWALAATCFTVLAFQLWATWHLHQKVGHLQAQVDSMTSGLDLDELRAQLRDLYDLRDLSGLERPDAETSASFRGHPTSADEDQKEEEDEEDPYTDEMLAEFAAAAAAAAEENGDGAAPTSLMGDGALPDAEEEEEEGSAETDDAASDEDEEDDADESGENADADEDNSLENRTLKEGGRQRRQADLSSHTQDGIPIFDRGYGVVYNRTEGLRIYQSLLATGGRGEPRSAGINWNNTDAPIQPHHRQNSFWRGKKDKSGPNHHGLKNGVPQPASDPTSAAQSVDSTDVQSTVSSSTAPRSSAPASGSSSGASGNVEFRHSRVKSSASSEVPSTPSPVQGDQKSWPTSRPVRNGRLETKQRGRHQQTTPQQQQQMTAAFKVNQPAPASADNRYPGNNGVQATADKEDRLPAAPHQRSGASSASHKKRVNKKQLRELPHSVTAVHLVADSRNGSSSPADNQVEVASRNELGLHTSWKLASWHSTHRTPSLVKIDGATLTVKQNGLYLVYAQVHYLDEHSVNAYEIFVNTEPFLRCVTTSAAAGAAGLVAGSSSAPRANTCHTSAATQLREGDKLFLRDIEPMRYSVLQPSKTFFGLVRLGPIAEFP